MKIRALKAFTIRDDSGNLLSIAHGGIAEVSSATGQKLIDDGLAEAYTLISPTGTVSITENGTVDVTQYASATVNVDDTTILASLIDRSITSIEIPNGVTEIGGYAFCYCSSLTSVTIPNSVTSIDDHAFGYCSSLTSVTIPNSVTSIAGFNYCSSLASVTVEAVIPPTLTFNTFGQTDSNLVIYVPAASVDVYKVASNWSNYANRIQAIPS